MGAAIIFISMVLSQQWANTWCYGW